MTPNCTQLHEVGQHRDGLHALDCHDVEDVLHGAHAV
jgi:hypothetical protein